MVSILSGEDEFSATALSLVIKGSYLYASDELVSVANIVILLRENVVGTSEKAGINIEVEQ